MADSQPIMPKSTGKRNDAAIQLITGWNPKTEK
jgi:hypothetical protein